MVKTRMRIPIGKPTKPHSSKKGKKGYNRKRNNKKLKEEIKES